MNILLAAIVLALVCWLVIWLLPSWRALRAQLDSLFPSGPAADAAQAKPAPRLRADKPPPVHTPTRPQSGKRHSVLPHQSRGH